MVEIQAVLDTLLGGDNLAHSLGLFDQDFSVQVGETGALLFAQVDVADFVVAVGVLVGKDRQTCVSDATSKGRVVILWVCAWNADFRDWLSHSNDGSWKVLIYSVSIIVQFWAPIFVGDPAIIPVHVHYIFDALQGHLQGHLVELKGDQWEGVPGDATGRVAGEPERDGNVEGAGAGVALDGIVQIGGVGWVVADHLAEHFTALAGQGVPHEQILRSQFIDALLAHQDGDALDELLGNAGLPVAVDAWKLQADVQRGDQIALAVDVGHGGTSSLGGAGDLHQGVVNGEGRAPHVRVAPWSRLWVLCDEGVGAAFGHKLLDWC